MALLASPSRAPGYTPENIDDIIYRVSAELERATAAAGVSGIYARDGLWDDDEDERAASGNGRGARKAGTSGASGSASGRSRSATVSLVKDGWRRHGAGVASGSGVGLGVMDVNVGTAGEIRKKASKSTLRGKGRRGELSVTVESGYSDYDAAATATPASFASPALTTSSTLMSPNSFATYFDSPALSSDFLPAPPPVPFAPAGTAATAKKSSWKRSMEKLFKSKSSSTLRDAYKAGETAPPVPALPASTLGAPFTPLPLGESRYPNFHDPQASPTLPADPFASTIDLAALPAAPRAKMPRASPSLRDLKAALHLPTHKPKMSKTKSLANLRAPAAPAPTSPPAPMPAAAAAQLSPVQMRRANTADVGAPSTPLPPIARPALQRKMTESPPLQPPRPYFHGRPAPPMPDRGASTSMPPSTSSASSRSVPSLTISTSLPATPASPSPPASPFALPLASPSTAAPTSPLPPLPASASAPPTAMIPQGSTMARSASGAVVLPRSRSTSLSLKGPPTSSSFFDLYEQLGIWPGVGDGNKEAQAKAEAKDILASLGKEQEVETKADDEETNVAAPEADTDNVAAPATETDNVAAHTTETDSCPSQVEVLADPAEPATADANPAALTESPSATFSSASWEAAISAFPLVDDPDTSLPYEGNSILSAMSNMAVASSSGHTTVGAASSGSQGQSASQGRPQAQTADADTSAQFTGTYYGMSRRGSGGSGGSGSAGSSRDPSRDRAGRLSRDEAWAGAASGSEASDSEGEQDDVPLSQLHPQAAAAQRIRQADAALRRQLRRAEREALGGRGRTRSRAGVPRRVARNPGEGAWDGEGGVPADILARKLERVVLARAAGFEGGEAARPAAFGRAPQRAGTLPLQLGARRDMDAGPSRLAGHPTSAQDRDRHVSGSSGASLARAKSTHHPESSAMAVARSSSSRRAEPLPPVPPPSAQPARSSTRSRAMSTAAHTQRPPPVDAAPPVPPAPAPAPAIPHRARPVLARCRIEGAREREVQLEIYADTVARDVLAMARSRGDLAEPAPAAAVAGAGAGLGWVVVEVFAESGLERPVREYEPLQAVVRGWDAAAPNCFALRQSARAAATWARSVPATPPFVGAYVQCETRKGKWSKRWLETRGGQVFLSKNDKNKDEVHINTLFVDVYSPTAPRAAPKPYVFALKRHEPAAAFEDASEHVTVLAADDGVGFKLLSAIFDARTYTLAKAQPHLLAPRQPAPAPAGAPAGAQPARPVHVNSRGQVRPQPAAHGQPGHTAAPAQPLVDLKRDKGAFTGRGLLKI